MPPFGPISRRDLIRGLRRLGCEGPSAGGTHDFMQRGDTSIIIPHPHRGDVSRDLVAQILREAGITREEWEHA